MIKRSCFLCAALLLALSLLPGIAAAEPTFYPMPGNGESHMVFADGCLYLLSPSSEDARTYSLYAYDPTAPNGYRKLTTEPFSDMDYPFLLRDHVYKISWGERTMRLISAPKAPSLPEEIEIIPHSLFPPSKSGNIWDEPSPELLSVSQGPICLYIISWEPGEMRALCRLDSETGEVKSHLVGPGLFGFSYVDPDTALYYASGKKSTQEHFYDICRLDWKTGEATILGGLPAESWGIAFDPLTDSLLYMKKGCLYRHLWDGTDLPLMDGLPKAPIDQRGFVLADRSYLTYEMPSGGYQLMALNLPEEN